MKVSDDPKNHVYIKSSIDSERKCLLATTGKEDAIKKNFAFMQHLSEITKMNQDNECFFSNLDELISSNLQINMKIGQIANMLGNYHMGGKLGIGSSVNKFAKSEFEGKNNLTSPELEQVGLSSPEVGGDGQRGECRVHHNTDPALFANGQDQTEFMEKVSEL